MNSRFIIGIDLGTTTCSLAYLDTYAVSEGVQQLMIPQWEREDSIINAPMLPSFCFLAPKNLVKKDTFRLPFQPQAEPVKVVLGKYARRQASFTPDRTIHAAKSWLSHRGINARDPILPWHSDTLIGIDRMAPVEVSALLLKHLKYVWDDSLAKFEPDFRFINQQVIITVPASFNEIASQLTLDAAAEAGFNLEHTSLLEEPQAAFYSWRFSRAAPYHYGKNDIEIKQFLDSKEKLNATFPQQEAQQTILVCDIGGGTTDFSLLALNAPKSKALLERVAVSEHILLGGDNIDLRIAYALEEKVKASNGNVRLKSREWAQLVAEARSLKEKCLATKPGEDIDLVVSITGAGASIIKNSISVAVATSEIKELVLEGFFPFCEGSDQPIQNASALREWGLPFASDSAVTRHLAAFLKNRKVDGVLFTGGTLSPKFIRERILAQICKWQGSAPAVLDNSDMNLAVSLGAAWYGATLRYKKGGVLSAYPRNLFMEVKSQNKQESALLCLVPKGYTGERSISLSPKGLRLVLGQPSSFNIYYSHEPENWKPGDIKLKWQGDSSFQSLSQVQTELSFPNNGKKLSSPLLCPISLEMNLSSTGLLTIKCVAQSSDALKQIKKMQKEKVEEQEAFKWALQFNVQEKVGEATAAKIENTLLVEEAGFNRALEEAGKKIEQIFGKPKEKLGASGFSNPNKLGRELEMHLGAGRDSWNLPLIRSLWPYFKQGETRRSRSENHETCWLHLSGFLLRPGFGYHLDQFRIRDLWKTYERGLFFPKGRQNQNQWWILWRRVAGGLNREQQRKIFARIFPAIRKKAASPEMYMLSGALELIDMDEKVKLGTQLVKQIKERRAEFVEQKIWSLSRIASRIPLYAGPAAIVRPVFVEEWFTQLEELNEQKPHLKNLKHFYIQSGRLIGDRELDISDEYRSLWKQRLEALGADDSQLYFIDSVQPLDFESKNHMFGESLPSGFVLDTML